MFFFDFLNKRYFRLRLLRWLSVLCRCIVAERTSAWMQVPRAVERIFMSLVRFRSLPVMALPVLL